MGVEDLHLLPRRGDIGDLARLGTQPHRDEEAEGAEGLGDSDRDHGEDEPRRLAEAPDHDDVGKGAHHQPAHHRDRQHGQVRHAVADVEHEGGDGGDGADGGGGEVEDAVGSVDEDEADGDHPVQGAQRDPLHELGQGVDEEDPDHEQEQDAGDGHPARLGGAGLALPEPAGPVERLTAPRPRRRGRCRRLG